MIPVLTLTKPDADAWRPTLPRADNWDLLSFYAAVQAELPPAPAIAEIGVAYGRSLLWLASCCLTTGRACAQLYGIDPYGRPWPGDGSGGSVQSPYAALQCLILHATPEEMALIHLIQLDSAEASLAFAPCSLDLVMIDGDHRYDAVLSDIDHWTPLVRPGGIVAGHDFGGAFPGVARAVQQRFRGRVVRQARMWAVRV